MSKGERKPTTARPQEKLELLFEVGCEEIPAGMLPRAEEELKVNLEKLLTAEDLIAGIIVETFSGPRRLTVHATGFPIKHTRRG